MRAPQNPSEILGKVERRNCDFVEIYKANIVLFASLLFLTHSDFPLNLASIGVWSGG